MTGQEAMTFCDGVWKKVNDHTVKIYHVVLAHDVTGAPSGYKIITQRNTLSHDGNSYHGTFTYSLYDDSNNLITTLAGTTAAQRIDFDHPFSLYEWRRAYFHARRGSGCSAGPAASVPLLSRRQDMPATGQSS